MKTENQFFDNFAVRIIIAVLTSALGISLIQGIAAEDCAYYTLGYFWEEFFFMGGFTKKFAIVFILAELIVLCLLIVCIRHEIWVCFCFSLFWRIGKVWIDSWGIWGMSFAGVGGYITPLLDIGVTVIIAIIKNEKLKMALGSQKPATVGKRVEMNKKGIATIALAFLLSIAPPYIFNGLFFGLPDSFEGIMEKMIFSFVLIAYVLILIGAFVVCGKRNLFIWNYGYALPEILLMFITILLPPEGSWIWYLFWEMFIPAIFVDLAATIYVNYLRSKRERF